MVFTRAGQVRKRSRELVYVRGQSCSLYSSVFPASYDGPPLQNLPVSTNPERLYQLTLLQTKNVG
jgi:hypothetical protein